MIAEWLAEVVELRPVRPIIGILFGRGRKIGGSVAEARLSVCRACEHFIESERRCRQCGCYMVIKTAWSGSKCPEGRWVV